MQLSNLYEALLKKNVDDVRPFLASDTWPDEWKRVTTKCYERFPLIALSAPLQFVTTLSDALRNRRSARTFAGDITEEKLSTLLTCGVGEYVSPDHTIPLRPYPSAGRRYPLECYLVLRKPVGHLLPGVYHYDVVHGGVRNIRTSLPEGEVFVKATAERYTTNATGALLFTWTRTRIEPKYGERAYKLMLIELGCVTQNLALIAHAMDIGMIHVGTFATNVVEPLLDIDGFHETHVHSLFFG